MSKPSIAIVDYQAGNLRSVQKALERFDVRAKITSDADDIRSADAVVFPGQGASDPSMRQLRASDLVAPITEFIGSGKPFLGVCLGLQLLLERSDEGPEPCLGILAGRVRRLPPGAKIPHMGWNRVRWHIEHPVFDGIPDNSYFYFVHSYYSDPLDRSVVAGTTSYTTEFCSAVAWDNVVALQFHPEKSGGIGIRLYQNFVRLVNDTTEARG